MTNGRTEAACDLFRRSIELKRAAGAQLNLARCEEELNHLPRALELYQQLQAELPSDDPRVPILQNRLKLLEAKVARVTLVLDPSSPAGAVATDRDGVFPLNQSRALMPGEHRLTVSAPGYHPLQYVLQLDPAETRTVTVTVGSPLEPAAVDPDKRSPDRAIATARSHAAPGPSRPLGSEPSGVAPKESSDPVNPLAYAVLGFGGASLLVSGIAGLLVLQQDAIVERECTPSAGGGVPECSHEGVSAADRGRLYSNIATASFVVGLAGVAGGSYCVFVHGATGGSRAAANASWVTLTGTF